jgi:hypothetical protein
MMGIGSYGLGVGDNATFVLVPAEAPADAVASRPARRKVYRKGVLVAADGELVRN